MTLFRTYISYNRIAKLRWIIPIVLSLVALLAICFHLLHPGQIIAQGDSFFGYDQFNELTKSFFAWDHLYSTFGQADSSSTWTSWLLIAGSFTKLFGASVSQILMLWLMMATGWLGMYIFVRRLGMSEAAAFLASWAYALNPWSQLFLSGGGNPPLLWLAALLPWYGMWITRAALEPAFRRTAALLMGLVSFCFLSVIGANPALVALFSIAILVFIGLGLFITADRFDFIKWSGRALMLVAIGSLWWLFPIANSYIGSVPLTTLSPGDWSFVITRSSLLNNLRLNPVWGWAHPEYHPYAHDYDANPLTYVAGFLLIFGLAAALVLVKADQVRTVRYVAVVALVMLFLSKGLHPPLDQLNVLLYKVPGMFLFREPTSKFPLVAIVMLAIALAMSIDLAAALKIFAKRWVAASGLGVAVCVIALSAWPTLTGEIVHGYTANYHNNVPGLPAAYVSLPNYWRKAADYLNTTSGGGGVLVLPADPYYQVDYSWGLYGADFLPNWLLRRQVMILGPLGYSQFPEASALRELIKRAINNHSSLLPRMLRDIGIRYVLYRGDIRVAPGAGSYPRTDLLLEFGAPRIAFGPLDIFDLGEPKSPVTESADWIAGEYGNSSVADRLELRELEERVPRIDLFSLPRNITRAPKAFEVRVDIPSPVRREVYENARAGVLTTGARSRIIASGNSGPGFGFVRVGTAASIRASFLGPLPNSLKIRIPPNALGHGVQPVGRPLLTTTTLYTDDKGRMIVEIANPAASFIRSDIRIGVLAPKETAFLLQGHALSYADTVQPSSGVIWSRFEGVMLGPGENQFVLYARPTRFARARSAQIAIGSRVGVVRFDNTRPAGKSNFGYAPAVEAYLSRGMHSAALIGGFPVLLSASSMPSVTVSLTAPSPSFDVGADMTIVNGTQRYLCYMRIEPIGQGESAEIVSALARCFDEASLPYELSNLLIERIDLEASLPPEIPSALSNFAINELVIAAHLKPPSELLLARATVSSDAADAMVTQNGDNVDVVLRPATRRRPPELLGRSVDVHLQSGASLAGRIVTDNGSLIEMQLKSLENAWVPLSSISEIVDRDAGLTTIDFRVPANMTFGSGKKISLAVEAPSIRDATISAETRRKRPPVALFETSDQQAAFTVVSLEKLLGGDHETVRAFRITFKVPSPLVGTSTAAITLSAWEPSPTYTDQVKIGQRLVDVNPGSRNFFVKRMPVAGGELPVQVETDDASLSTLTVGSPPCACDSEIPAHVTKYADGFIIAQLPLKGSAFVLTNELYSWQWVGIRLDHSISLMPHLAADGWRNAWVATDGGTVVLFSIAVVLQLAFLIFGAFALAYFPYAKR